MNFRINTDNLDLIVFIHNSDVTVDASQHVDSARVHHARLLILGSGRERVRINYLSV